MEIEPEEHQSYLLRVWPSDNRHELRATLISIRNPNICHHFATLGDLFIHLQQSILLQVEVISGTEEE